MQDNLPTESENMEVWPKVRKLLVLQLKLYIDAFRDITLSALAFGAFVIDLIQKNDGPDSYFEHIMRLGRRTELAINLFNQYDESEVDGHNVDSILKDVEDRLRR